MSYQYRVRDPYQGRWIATVPIRPGSLVNEHEWTVYPNRASAWTRAEADRIARKHGAVIEPVN